MFYVKKDKTTKLKENIYFIVMSILTFWIGFQMYLISYNWDYMNANQVMFIGLGIGWICGILTSLLVGYRFLDEIKKIN
jgi:hypothetical protein